MKTTEEFRKTIEAFIEREKEADALFAECVDGQPEKTIQGCVNYILHEVKKSNIVGWTDAEIYSMAKHFYDEKDIKDPGSVNARVVVNHHVDLSEEEKRKAKEKALADFEKAERERLEKEKKKREEKEKKMKEAKEKALQEKRERESKMQLDLFAM